MFRCARDDTSADTERQSAEFAGQIQDRWGAQNGSVSHPTGTVDTMSYPFLTIESEHDDPVAASCPEAGGPADASAGVVTAHGPIVVGPTREATVRERREHLEETRLAPGATRSRGSGNRAVAEEPDPYRTCFERDRDRIKHSRPFRRLAGKCQVFVAPDNDHLRTRLTHAIEVAQVAVSIARPVGLNVALTEAAAIGHDCGHGPAGHASEGALSPFVADGYHHAVYGADVVLEPLNLCVETLDAIRNHSWNRPTPLTPEGEVVAWADRIAYVCHDFEDAVSAGIVTPADLPGDVRRTLGEDRRTQLGSLITAMVDTIATNGIVAMDTEHAEALAAFRAFNFDRIYLRAESVAQADRAAEVITALCSYYIDHPERVIHHGHRSPYGTTRPTDPALRDPVADAVRYVSGMTDRYLLRCAVDELGWDPNRLPAAV